LVEGLHGCTSGLQDLPPQDYDVRNFVRRKRSFVTESKGDDIELKRSKSYGDQVDFDSSPIDFG